MFLQTTRFSLVDVSVKCRLRWSEINRNSNDWWKRLVYTMRIFVHGVPSALLLPDLRHMVGGTAVGSVFHSINLFFQLESVSFSINPRIRVKLIWRPWNILFFRFWQNRFASSGYKTHTIFEVGQNSSSVRPIIPVLQLYGLSLLPRYLCERSKCSVSCHVKQLQEVLYCFLQMCVRVSATV